MVIGKTASDTLRRETEAYFDRLKRYLPAEIMVLPDVKRSERQKELEGDQMLAKVTAADRLILLDERGAQYTSREFAQFMQKQQSSGCKRLFLAIGGPYGFSEAVYARADGQISLSRMTFSHEMVRLFIAEQLYRAQTILHNEPYHHD